MSTFPDLTAWAAANPWLLAIPATLIMIIAARVAGRRGNGQRDPQRLFTAAQRQEGMGRVMTIPRTGKPSYPRCEMEVFPFMRCTARASHGDHHYPWSRGGASTLENYVAACARHNLAKGAKTPSWGQTQRMEARRRKYFPAGSLTRPGQRLGV